jgi:heme exporter protein A
MIAPTLRFDDLRRGFGHHRVLEDVTGAVDAGELLLVTGANGSGKSTLLRCLAGLLAPEDGSITLTLDGRALPIAERRRAVGYLAPDLEFYGELSVLENLLFFARLRGAPESEAQTVLRRIGLPPRRAAAALSSGMTQRLRWGWALLGRPRLLLLDEPFQNLDTPGQELASALLAEHLGDGGAAVVASPVPLELPHVAPRRLELAG